MTTPWYSEGLRFSCTQCGRCCAMPGYVWVGIEEMQELADYLDLPFDDFTRRYVRRVGHRYSLIDKPTGECIFWNRSETNPGCEVYPARPRQCRTFPFWKKHLTDEDAWRRVERESPGAGQGRLYSADDIESLTRGEGETGEPGADNAPG